MIKLGKVYRCSIIDDGWDGPRMADDEHGGFVQYTTYCKNVSKLQKRIDELEKTIVGMVQVISND